MNISQRFELTRFLHDDMSGISWPAHAQEPDYVAKLARVLPGFVMIALSHLLPGRKIAVGGSYIHQKPLAHFVKLSGMRDPELGDLLIVCREARRSGTVYNAMLLQAKRTTDPFYTTIPVDHQFVLYSKWPEFEYKRAGFLNGKKRSIYPKTITQGAQYLLIDDSNSPEFFTATVDRPLNASRLFAITLASVLSFDDGRTFQVDHPRDDWSQMIIDLLGLSATSVFNRSLSRYHDIRRWSGSAAFDFLLHSETLDESFADYYGEDKEAISGISVICVDLGSNENI